MATTVRRGTRRSGAGVSELIERARACGCKSARLIDAATVVTAPWVRLKCQYGCDGYGTSLCCPPHTPTAQEMAQVVRCYSRAILFEAERGRSRKIAVDLERKAFLAGHYKALGLGAGPCPYCRAPCAMESGCRHSDRARPSMEACGIDVFATVRANGFAIQVVRDHRAPQRYFGLVLLD